MPGEEKVDKKGKCSGTSSRKEQEQTVTLADGITKGRSSHVVSHTSYILPSRHRASGQALMEKHCLQKLVLNSKSWYKRKLQQDMVF